MNQNKHANTLPKAERIKSKLTIDRLFAGNNQSVMAYPFRVVYMTTEQSHPTAAMMVSVPKKRFHNAVDRNRIKRMAREAYRLQKQQLVETLQERQHTLAIAFICVASHMCTYKTLHANMGKALAKISEAISQDHHTAATGTDITSAPPTAPTTPSQPNDTLENNHNIHQ